MVATTSTYDTMHGGTVATPNSSGRALVLVVGGIGVTRPAPPPGASQPRRAPPPPARRCAPPSWCGPLGDERGRQAATAHPRRVVAVRGSLWLAL